MSPVPTSIFDFEIDCAKLGYAGNGLQRPECILAEADGSLWVADARGGVVHLFPDGRQQTITEDRSHLSPSSGIENSRLLHGTLPNGLAFADNGDILIANFGTDRLEVMTREGESKVTGGQIDGRPIGKVNFVLRDSKNRIWITISTKIKNWMHALRPDLADGYIARYVDGTFRIVAEGFHFTNEIRMDAREEYLYVAETTGGCISRMRVSEDGCVERGRDLRPLQSGQGRLARRHRI